MTQIDCYHDQPDRLTQALRLAAFAWAKRKSITFYIPDPRRADAFDKALWAKDPQSFIPHCRADDALAAQTLILLSDDLDAVTHDPGDELLVNLADAVPPGFARFQRLFEIVSRRPDDQALARERMAFYKDRGYPITYRKTTST